MIAMYADKGLKREIRRGDTMAKQAMIRKLKGGFLVGLVEDGKISGELVCAKIDDAFREISNFLEK